MFTFFLFLLECVYYLRNVTIEKVITYVPRGMGPQLSEIDTGNELYLISHTGKFSLIIILRFFFLLECVHCLRNVYTGKVIAFLEENI